jgi:ribosomal protein S3AE
MMDSKDYGKRILVRFFKKIAAHADVYWHDDYQAEIEAAVDAIIKAAVDEAVKQALRKMPQSALE